MNPGELLDEQLRAGAAELPPELYEWEALSGAGLARFARQVFGGSVTDQRRAIVRATTGLASRRENPKAWDRGMHNARRWRPKRGAGKPVTPNPAARRKLEGAGRQRSTQTRLDGFARRGAVMSIAGWFEVSPPNREYRRLPRRPIPPSAMREVIALWREQRPDDAFQHLLSAYLRAYGADTSATGRSSQGFETAVWIPDEIDELELLTRSARVPKAKANRGKR